MVIQPDIFKTCCCKETVKKLYHNICTIIVQNKPLEACYSGHFEGGGVERETFASVFNTLTVKNNHFPVLKYCFASVRDSKHTFST